MSPTSTTEPTPADPLVLPGRTTTRQASAAGRTASACRAPATRGLLFVVRESDEYDLRVFSNMLQQTLRRYSSRPSVAIALKMGATVLEDTPEGAALRRELGAVPMLRGTRRFGLRFTIDGDTFLYAQASARSTYDDHNAYTSAVVETIELASPEVLVCGPVSRLVRLKSHGERIGDTAKRLRVKVAMAEAPDGLDLSDDTGWMIWQSLTTYADLEYRNIIKRLLNGTVYRLRNNRWPRGEARVPFGYSADKHGNLSILDRETAAIRRLLELGADRTLSLTDIVNRANAEKLTFRSAAKGPALLSGWDNPENALAAFYDKVALYGTGVYDISWTVDREIVTKVFDHEVETDDATGKGFIPFKVRFPLPPDGYAEPETLRAVAELRIFQPTPSGARTETYPFAQLLDIREGDQQTKLIPSDDRYLLRRRKITEDTRTGFGRYEGDLLLTIESANLHLAFAETCIREIRAATSLQPKINGGAQVDQVVLDPAELEAAIAQERELVAGFDRLAALATAEADRGRYQTSGSEAAKRLTDLKEARSALTGMTSETGFLDRPVAGYPSIHAALDELAICGPEGRVQLAGAMTELVENLSIHPDGETHARWTATLRIRSGAGAAYLGPVAGRVRTVAKRGRSHDRWKETAERILSGRAELADVAADQNVSAKAIRRGIVEKGTAFPVAMVDAMLDAPAPMRSLVWAVHGPGAAPCDGHQNVDERFTTAVRRAWHPAPFRWTKNWLHPRQSRTNRAFDLINADGPQTLAEIRKGLFCPEPYAYELLNGMYRAGKGGVVLPGVLQRDATDPTYLTFRRCQTCDEALTVLAFAPGVDSGLICTTCLTDGATGLPIPRWLLEAVQASDV